MTPELFNEIQRNPDFAERSSRMSSARKFDCVESSHEDFEAALKIVESVCGLPSTERDKADQRQLAWTIGAGADVFVTRDQKLLGHADELYRAYGVTVERPSDVIARFEEIRHEREYQRDRLIGTDIQIARKSSEAELLADAFLSDRQHEKRSEFVRLLNQGFANPDRFVCKVIYGDSVPLCLYLIDKHTAKTCDLRLLRLHRQFLNTRLLCRLTARDVKALFDAIAIDTGQGKFDRDFVGDSEAIRKRLARSAKKWPDLRKWDIFRLA